MPGVKREGVQNPTVFQGGEERGRGVGGIGGGGFE